MRFLSVNETNGAVSFPTTVNDCRGRLLFLGSDVLSSTSVNRKNHIRVHTRYSKHGLASRLTLSGFKIEGINNSGTMWFYSIQGLFQVVFELHSKEAQRDCLTTLQETWLERFSEPVLQPEGIIRFHKRLRAQPEPEAHIDLNSGKQDLTLVKSKLPLKKLVVVPDDDDGEIVEEGQANSDNVSISGFFFNAHAADFVKEETVSSSTSQGPEAGDFVERLISFVTSDISSAGEVSHQITCQILLALDYLKHISSEDVEHFAKWGFAFFEMMEQYLALVKSDMYEDSVDDTFGLPREKYALLYVVSEWLGKEYYKLESEISKKVDMFKQENLTTIDSLPPSESTIDMLFPSFMKQLLVCWLGASGDHEGLMLDWLSASAFADHNYSPRAKKSKTGSCDTDRPLFPLVQLILEFATNSLVSGVAHVIYSRLRLCS